MGEIKFKLSDKTEAAFRKKAMDVFGYGKGSLSLAAEEAFREWAVARQKTAEIGESLSKLRGALKHVKKSKTQPQILQGRIVHSTMGGIAPQAVGYDNRLVQRNLRFLVLRTAKVLTFGPSLGKIFANRQQPIAHSAWRNCAPEGRGMDPVKKSSVELQHELGGIRETRYARRR